MNKPTISIIIVNYNVREFLVNALHSLQKALIGIQNEIFVVDNASIDDSVEVLKRDFPSVILIENNENLGFAKANNLALKRCRGDFILLLNPDTLIGEDTIRVMLNFFTENPTAAIAGCKILNSDGTLQLACRRSYPTPWSSFSKLSGLSSLFPRTKLFGKYNLTYLDPDKTYEVEALSGSFVMFRREVYEDIGGLDEDFFMYGEDLDWFYRAHKKNWKIFYVHSTKIIHFKGESTKKSDFDAVRKFYEAMHLFVKKHYKSTSLVVPILRIGIFLRALIAFFGKFWIKNFPIIFDIIFINIAIFLSEYLRFGRFFAFPQYAYPFYYIFVTIFYLVTFSSLGIYQKYRFSISRSLFAVIVSFLIVTLFELFFKNFAFSRATLIFLLIITTILLPGWRFVYRIFEGSRSLSLKYRQKNILGPRTLIIGYNSGSIEFIKNLKKKLREGLDNIVGIMTDVDIKESSDFKIIKSNNLNDIIDRYKIEQILFSINALSYSEILNFISKCKNKNIVFKIIPKETDILNEKNILPELDLVQIDLKINNFFNKFVKRIFDIVLSFFLMFILFPIKIFSKGKNKISVFYKKIFEIFKGNMTFVGRSLSDNLDDTNICKVGLVSLAKLNLKDNVNNEEIQRLDFLYAKNQSFFLDCEILINSVIDYFKEKSKN